jgi:putative heme iron utilization protein
VTVAFEGGNPIFLISGLAEHTKNLERDPRSSLLVAEPGFADPLANGRVTMLGSCTPVVEGEEDSARAAFLAAHPNSTYYADFRDFAFWKLHVESVRYIGGYGRMSWIRSHLIMRGAGSPRRTPKYEGSSTGCLKAGG